MYNHPSARWWLHSKINKRDSGPILWAASQKTCFQVVDLLEYKNSQPSVLTGSASVDSTKCVSVLLPNKFSHNSTIG